MICCFSQGNPCCCSTVWEITELLRGACASLIQRGASHTRRYPAAEFTAARAELDPKNIFI